MRHFLRSIMLVTSFATSIRSVSAQTSFRIGPRIGYDLATVNYREANSLDDIQNSFRSGVQGGIAASIVLKHFALQPSLLYIQKGFQLQRTFTLVGAGTVSQNNTTTRLNYLILPLNFAFTFRQDSEGFQLSIGPYVGILLGGDYHTTAQITTAGSTIYSSEQEGNVKTGNSFGSSLNDNNFYSRSLDTGGQIGVGYHYHQLLTQIEYSLGFNNLGAIMVGNPNSPTYHTRTLQVSLNYLFSFHK